MIRFEDSPGLFGNGVGVSTSGNIKCGVCGTIYNDGVSGDKGIGDYVALDDFAGMTVCECCFTRIEEAVWRRRRFILGWFLRRIEACQTSNQADKTALDAVLDGGAQPQKPRPASAVLRIRNKGSGDSYDLDTDPAGRPIAVRTVTITNPQEWELLPE